MKNSNVIFSDKENESIKNISDNLLSDLNYKRPIHSEFIILFSYLETLFSFYIAYNENLYIESDIYKFQTNSKYTIKFINTYLLSDRNKFYSDNKKYFKRLDGKKLRLLRNKLSHFYSVGGNIILINHNNIKHGLELIKKLEKQKNYDNAVLSSENLYGLINGCFGLLIEEWYLDYNNENKVFQEKILNIKNIVDNNGSVEVKF